jgi:hypothetical protein
MDAQVTSPFYETGNLYGAKPRTNPRSEGLATLTESIGGS